MSLTEAMPQIAPRPILLISGGGTEARRVTQFYETAVDPKELWVVPGAGHTGAMRHDPAAYEEKIIDFFDAALNP